MASLAPIKSLVYAAKAKQTATVVFIHGLGDSGAGWYPVADMLSQALPHVKWILPSARSQPVTINGGFPSPSWFDILSLDKIDGPQDERGLLESRREIEQIIGAEVDSGTPSNRIILGGFSQGAAMSLLTGLTSERKLGGLVALSGYLPLADKMTAMMTPHAKSLPLFMGHGTADPVVKFQFAEATIRELQKLGITKADQNATLPVGLSFHKYEMLTHSVDDEELEHLTEWMKRVIPPVDA